VRNATMGNRILSCGAQLGDADRCCPRCGTSPVAKAEHVSGPIRAAVSLRKAGFGPSESKHGSMRASKRGCRSEVTYTRRIIDEIRTIVTLDFLSERSEQRQLS
jgi:hypothetical protein